MKTPVCLLLLFALVWGGVAADNARQIQEGDIREAVFRWQFQHNEAYVYVTKVFFLEVGENNDDPSDEFIKRFADNKPPVRKGSASNDSFRTGVLDKTTGEHGVLLHVYGIEWKSDTEVEVKGGCHESKLSGSGNTYTLKKREGKWEVTNDKENWIS